MKIDCPTDDSIRRFVLECLREKSTKMSAKDAIREVAWDMCPGEEERCTPEYERLLRRFARIHGLSFTSR
jgi:hypothetical protein